MTNGEKLQETFPNIRITVCESYVQVMGENYEFNNTYPLAWWNAEYEELKGRWIREKSVHGWDGRSYQCSVCGRSVHLDTAVEDIYDYPYCHCGAKMEEVEE